MGLRTVWFLLWLVHTNDQYQLILDSPQRHINLRFVHLVDENKAGL